MNDDEGRVSVGENWVDSGDGQCSGGGCQWQRNNWTWTCCDCDPGYVSYTGGACLADGNVAVNPKEDPCVGCSPGQMLGGDAADGFYCLY